MDQEYISEYFVKATALVLASSGIESIEKQALYVLAKEAERYAHQLGKHASRLAESSRRSDLTSADIKAAAMMISPQQASHSVPSFVSSESKRRLRSSVESHAVIDKTAITSTDLSFPQSGNETFNKDDMIAEQTGKRNQHFPEWLQNEIEKRPSLGSMQQQDNHPAKDAKGIEGRRSLPQTENSKQVGPLSLISSLVLAEEESRNILTKKTRIDNRESSEAH